MIHETLSTYLQSIPEPLPYSQTPATKRYEQLTMPPGALERIFIPVLRVLAQRPNKMHPWNVSTAAILFAGDHGVAAHHPVSAFPQAVTGQMVANFAHGGAAMAVLCEQRQAPLCVVDIGVAYPYPKPQKERMPANISFIDANLATKYPEYAQGAQDITQKPALTLETFQEAFTTGRKIAQKVIEDYQPDFLILGEMGIGNTTPATAIACHLLNLSPQELTGPGTGLSPEQKQRKAHVIQQAIKRHEQEFSQRSKEPDSVLQSLGGFELVAIAGAAFEATLRRTHILLDGTITTAALLPLALSSKNFRQWLIPGHMSSEPIHQEMLKNLDLKPLLHLDLRLGEGSGAALAAGLLYDAVNLLNKMATFESAGISQKA